MKIEDLMKEMITIIGDDLTDPNYLDHVPHEHVQLVLDLLSKDDNETT